MPKLAEPGKPATFKHARVVYSPFGAPPSAQYILTADPWAFLTAWINQELRGKRGKNRIRLERALYYANLAESFYEAARRSSLPAEGTLAYYGILNLVKCFLSVRGVDLETQIEHHGLSLVQSRKQTIQIPTPANNVLGIFHEFAKELGVQITAKTTLSVAKCCAHIPELHEMAFTLGHLSGSKRGFLPLQIRFLLNDADSYLFTEIAYERETRDSHLIADPNPDSIAHNPRATGDAAAQARRGNSVAVPGFAMGDAAARVRRGNPVAVPGFPLVFPGFPPTRQSMHCAQLRCAARRSHQISRAAGARVPLAARRATRRAAPGAPPRYDVVSVSGRASGARR